MKNLKKLLMVLIVILLLVTSCGKIPKLENGQEAVATLKGGNISIDSLYEEMKNEYALSVLVDMVDRQILEGIYPADDDEQKYIDSRVDQLKLSYEAYYSNDMTFEGFLYTYYSVQDEEMLRNIFSLNYKRDLANDDYIKKEVITDKEIDEYYEKNIYGSMKASHILFKANYEDGASDEDKEKAKNEAKTKAEEIIKQLNETDKDKVAEVFAQLAKDQSEDSSASNGGDLGWFESGDMVASFEDATKKLAVDEYTKEPVESDYGYHVILKTGQKDKPSLEDSKDKILDALIDEKKEEDLDNKLQTRALIALRKDYDLEIQDDELKRQYKSHVESVAYDDDEQ